VKRRAVIIHLRISSSYEPSQHTRVCRYVDNQIGYVADAGCLSKTGPASAAVQLNGTMRFLLDVIAEKPLDLNE
jgi:hypothetical protein